MQLQLRVVFSFHFINAFVLIKFEIFLAVYVCMIWVESIHTCMKFAKNKTDIIILQESWMRDENIIILHSSFICIKSNVQITQVKVLIFVAKNAKKFTCTSRSNIVNIEDMQAISIANNKIQREILLFNIYKIDDEIHLYVMSTTNLLILCSE